MTEAVCRYCGKKNLTKQDAERIADRGRRNRNERFQPYKCRRGGRKWHVGHSLRRVRV